MMRRIESCRAHSDFAHQVAGTCGLGVARPFDTAIPLAFRTTVTDRVADDDPSCGGAYPYCCRYFRVAVPHDGALLVTIRWKVPASYPFDLGVHGPTGPVADGEIGVGLDRTARGRVLGGTTYLIEVWSFLNAFGTVRAVYVNRAGVKGR